MLRTGIVLCAIGLMASSLDCAAETITMDALSAAQRRDAVAAASDTAIIESRGVSKTKAQWRNEFMARHPPLSAAQLQSMESVRDQRLKALQKVFQDAQNRDIAAQNAEAEAKLDNSQ